MRKNFNKKILFSIVCFSLFLIFLPGFFVLAQDSYKIDSNQTITIDKHGVCRITSNQTGSPPTFIPVKTSSEWAEFRFHYPSHINLTECFAPPTGSLSCSGSTQNSITLYYSYSNGTNVSLFMGGSYLYNFGSGSNSGNYTVSSLSSGSTYTFYLRNGTSGSSPLIASISCTTQPASASGSLSCYSSTQNSITLSYSYSNATNASLFRDNTHLYTFGSGTNSGTYNVSGLSAGTNYYFYLRNGTYSTSPLLASTSCATQTAPSGGCSYPFYECSRRSTCEHCVTVGSPACPTTTTTRCCVASSYCEYGPVSAPCCCCNR